MFLLEHEQNYTAGFDAPIVAVLGPTLELVAKLSFRSASELRSREVSFTFNELFAVFDGDGFSAETGGRNAEKVVPTATEFATD